MKKALTKNKILISNVFITGNKSNIYGNAINITGNVSEITGNVTGLRGDVSGIRGNVDDCELTEEDRKNGIDINDLIK